MNNTFIRESRDYKMIQEIKNVVKSILDIDLDDAESTISRKTKNVDARMIYFYLARNATDLSYEKLGKTIYPIKDHSTVLCNVKKAAQYIEIDKIFSSKLHGVNEKYKTIDLRIRDEEMSLEEAVDKIRALEALNKEISNKNVELLDTIKDLIPLLRSHRVYLIKEGYDVKMSKLYNYLKNNLSLREA